MRMNTRIFPLPFKCAALCLIFGLAASAQTAKPAAPNSAASSQAEVIAEHVNVDPPGLLGVAHEPFPARARGGVVLKR